MNGTTEIQVGTAAIPPEILNEIRDVYEKEYASVFRFVYSRLDNTDDAADIVSGSFLKALQSAGKFEKRQGATVKSWIYRIALNEVLLFYRHKKVERKYYVEEKHLNRILSDTDYEEPVTEVLKQSLEQLSDNEYELIQMKYFDGLSFAEMASVLGKSEESLRVKTHRIRRRMHDTILRLSRSKGVEILLTISLLFIAVL
jgi:RNA polymerase sigma-70 factor (ECF subfamily)